MDVYIFAFAGRSEALFKNFSRFIKFEFKQNLNDSIIPSFSIYFLSRHISFTLFPFLEPPLISMFSIFNLVEARIQRKVLV
ncbi:hypothetical protein BpHYR1_037542 [Brachionus plicatilis]|uniref:Uncharacterized protein n=1 Tax=Brachionus plicatilis TaxID=10195 RepID=A0A3M7RZG9_BRAPC|nr:hypothetical protein BpHYR1_037542 [Brachionus plicatilis]